MADNPVILITRPEPQASLFAAKLIAALGSHVEIVAIPLLELNYFESPICGGDFDAAIFTSENGVQAADKNWAGHKGQAFAVGPRTAHVAQECGWEAETAQGRSADLVELANRKSQGKKFIWPCGEDARPELMQSAKRLGVDVTPLIVYSMKKTTIDAGAFDRLAQFDRVIMPVFSPRSAQIARDQFIGLQKPVHVVAISQNAAAVFGDQVEVAIADAPNGAAMIRAISTIFQDAST